MCDPLLSIQRNFIGQRRIRHIPISFEYVLPMGTCYSSFLSTLALAGEYYFTRININVTVEALLLNCALFPVCSRATGLLLHVNMGHWEQCRMEPPATVGSSTNRCASAAHPTPSVLLDARSPRIPHLPSSSMRARRTKHPTSSVLLDARPPHYCYEVGIYSPALYSLALR